MAYFLEGQYETEVSWVQRAINRMPRWYYEHFLLVASYMALVQTEKAKDAAKGCLTTLPDTRILDLDRVPLKNPERMAELRNALPKAGIPR